MPLDEEAAKRTIAKLKDLPTLPQVVAKVMQVVGNPMATAADLNEVISMDQALTAKVLRLANSAYYGFPKEITNITQAVVILGFNTIRNLALSVSVHRLLFEGRERGRFSHRDFWKHSVATAVLAKILAKKVGFKSEENAFTAGLLHDIGKNFFDQHSHEEFNQALQASRQTGRPLWMEEREILSLDHGQVGRWMAEKWNLPADLTAAIALHHQPNLEDAHGVLVAIVHAANEISREQGLGSSGDESPVEVRSEVLQFLKLGDREMKEIQEELGKGMKEAENFFMIGR